MNMTLIIISKSSEIRIEPKQGGSLTKTRMSEQQPGDENLYQADNSGQPSAANQIENSPSLNQEGEANIKFDQRSNNSSEAELIEQQSLPASEIDSIEGYQMSISKEQQQEGELNSNIQNEQQQSPSEGAAKVIKFSKKPTLNQAFLGNTSNSASLRKSTPFSSSYAPWMSQKTKAIANPLLKLHNEIIDFYLVCSEEDTLHQQALSYFTKLQGNVFRTFPECEIIAPFLLNKVGLRNSEVEIFLLFPRFDPLYNSKQNNKLIAKCEQCLKKSHFHKVRFHCENPPSSHPHRQRRIFFTCSAPTKHQEAAIRFNIKIVEASEWTPFLSLINETLENNLECKFLYLVFFAMIEQRGYENSVKSYMLFGLIALFVFERKRQKSRSLTENLLKFLQYYGMGPFTQRKITYLGNGQFDIKTDPEFQSHQQKMGLGSANNNMSKQPNSNTVTAPFSFWISKETEISHTMIREFFNLLKNRYKLLSSLNFQSDESVLAVLIHPNQTQDFAYCPPESRDIN